MQTVAFAGEEFRHQLVAGAQPSRFEFIGEMTHALGSPAQRVLGITARGGFHQFEQLAEQSRVFDDSLLAPAARAPDARGLGWSLGLPCLLEFAATNGDGTPRHPGASRDGNRAAKAQRLRFGGRPKPSETFIQKRGEMRETLPKLSGVMHEQTLYTMPASGATLIS